MRPRRTDRNKKINQKNSEKVKKYLEKSDSSDSDSSSSNDGDFYSSDNPDKPKSPRQYEVRTTGHPKTHASPLRNNLPKPDFELPKSGDPDRIVPSPTLQVKTHSVIPEKFKYTYSPTHSPTASPTRKNKKVKDNMKLALEELNLNDIDVSQFDTRTVKSFPKRPQPQQPTQTQQFESIFDIPTSESNEPFTMETQPIEISQADIIPFYLIHVYEEGNRLFLFGKYQSDSSQFGTICVQINHPCRYLQFSVKDGETDQLKKEIKEILGDNLININIIDRQESNSNEQKPYIEVAVNPTTELTSIPINGNYYDSIHGITASLTESFMMRKGIRGLCWVEAKCSQSTTQYTSVPLFLCDSEEDISVLKTDKERPPMNIAILATRMCRGEFVIASVRIMQQWDIERNTEYQGMRNAGHSVTTFANFPPPKRSAGTATRFVSSERELVRGVLDLLEKCDIDIIAGFDLLDTVLPSIVSKIDKISQRSYLGRFRRVEDPIQIEFAWGGRLVLDLKPIYENFLNIKSPSLSAVAQRQGVDLPPMDPELLRRVMTADPRSDHSKATLVGISRRETNILKTAIERESIFMLTTAVIKISGATWEAALCGRWEAVVEAQLVLSFMKKSHIVPDRSPRQRCPPLDAPSLLEDAVFVTPGVISGLLVVIDAPHFVAQLVREQRACFVQPAGGKDRAVLPALMGEFIHTRDKMERACSGDMTEEEAARTKSWVDGIELLLKLSERFLVNGSRRFDVEKLRNGLRTRCTDVIREIQSSFPATFESKVVMARNDRIYVSVQCNERERVHAAATQLVENFNKEHTYMKLFFDTIEERAVIIDSKKMVTRGECAFQTRSDCCDAEFDLITRMVRAVMDAPNDVEAKIIASRMFTEFCSNIRRENASRHFDMKAFTFDFSIHQVPSPDISAFVDRQKALMPPLESRIRFVMCRGSGEKSVPKAPSEVKDVSLIDHAYYRKHATEAVAEAMEPFGAGIAAAIRKGPAKDEVAIQCPVCRQFTSYESMEQLACGGCGCALPWRLAANQVAKSLREIVGRCCCGVHCDEFMCRLNSSEIPLQGCREHLSPWSDVRMCEGTNTTGRDVGELLSNLMKKESRDDGMRELTRYVRSICGSLISRYGIIIEDDSDAGYGGRMRGYNSQSDCYSFLSQ